MAYQLIYTSAPASLTLGRTGFSTVARTRDMPEKLAAAVERCGVYEIGAGEVFSHRTLQYGGQTWHILTRMRDAGTDYTNRNNYVAHHIAIPQSDIGGLANPAEILAQWSGWVSKWSGDPRYIDDVLGLENIKAKNSLPAKNWEKYFGNPAKAALLSNNTAQISASADDARTLLDLFSESLLLNVNPADAWDITFTTSMASGENPNAYLWKTDTSGNAAAINLSAKTAPAAPDNRAAKYALTGEKNNRERYNLKVGAPKAAVRYEVVETQNGGSKNAIIYGISATITLGAIAAAAFALMPERATRESDAEPRELPVLASTPETPTPTESKTEAKPEKKSLAQTAEEVREKIASDDFAGALEMWKNSGYAEKNPSLEVDFLADIGTRADSLMRNAENLLTVGTPQTRAEAAKLLAAARLALDIPNIPKRETRETKWKTLKQK